MIVVLMILEILSESCGDSFAHMHNKYTIKMNYLKKSKALCRPYFQIKILRILNNTVLYLYVFIFIIYIKYNLWHSR